MSRTIYLQLLYFFYELKYISCNQFDSLTSWIGVAMIGSLPTRHEIFPERPYAAQNVISAAR